MGGAVYVFDDEADELKDDGRLASPAPIPGFVRDGRTFVRIIRRSPGRTLNLKLGQSTTAMKTEKPQNVASGLPARCR
jgi:hypothetical protein